jgi:hypothetical protein
MAIDPKNCRAWEEEWSLGSVDTDVEEHCLRWARVTINGKENMMIIDGESPFAQERARLAIAAPDLYKALEAAVDAPFGGPTLEWHAAAHAALAKARGENP